jgi:hypothetical protein
MTQRRKTTAGGWKSYFKEPRDALHPQQVMYPFKPQRLPPPTRAPECAAFERWFSWIPGPTPCDCASGTTARRSGMSTWNVSAEHDLQSVAQRLRASGKTAEIYSLRREWLEGYDM